MAAIPNDKMTNGGVTEEKPFVGCQAHLVLLYISWESKATF